MSSLFTANTCSAVFKTFSTMIDILVRVVSALLMIGMPIGLFLFLRGKIGATWRFIRIGAATFVASQVFHIPFNMVVLPLLMGALGLGSLQDASGANLWVLAIFLGLSAGVFEETSRYLVFRFWLTDRERTWKTAVTLGAGHGGCEAILVGFGAMIVLIQMIVFRHSDLSKILPPDKVKLVQEQLTHYWSLSWYEALMPAVERVSAMTFHVSASVLVLQVFLRKNCLWLGAAIAFHTAIDTIAVVAIIQKWNPLVLEAVLAMSIIPLASAIIFYLRQDSAADDFQPVPQQDVVDAEDTDDPSLVSELEEPEYEEIA